MKKIDLIKLINETIHETMNEVTPPGFPPALKKKLKAEYPPEKAYPAMWAIHKKMTEGDERIKEMWMAYENKNECATCGCGDPTDDHLPKVEEHEGSDDEKREVQIGKEILERCEELTLHGNDEESSSKSRDAIVKLAQELIKMHEPNSSGSDPSTKMLRTPGYARKEFQSGYSASLREDYYDGPDDDRSEFADPHGKSALRAASRSNPRNRPCPTCKRPNMLTPADVAKGYQCDQCADALEGPGMYEGDLSKTAKAIGAAGLIGMASIGSHYLGKLDKTINIGNTTYLVVPEDHGTVPYDAKVVKGPDGKIYKVWSAAYGYKTRTPTNFAYKVN